jgi:putative endonuclease
MGFDVFRSPFSRKARYFMNPPSQNSWHVYIIHCSDNSLYTGITTDVARRFLQHQTGRGAKYFRGRQPLSVIYRESCADRSTAVKKELKIKKLTRQEKCRLLSSISELTV